MIISPYTWLEEFTKREEWLGGYKQDGENVTSLEGLDAALSPHFRLLGCARDMPFVIRETGASFSIPSPSSPPGSCYEPRIRFRQGH